MWQAPWKTVRKAYGLGRTFASAYAVPGRRERLKLFYQPFIGAGDLAFDIGSQTGERLRAFRDLGARVVALEPQPAFFDLLCRVYGEDRNVTLHPWGAGKEDETKTLFIATTNPTLTTFSSEWIETIQNDRKFRGVQWDTALRVPVTTLDHLIALHGKPRLCRISGEGWEPEVLFGLSHAIAAVSFDCRAVGIPHAVRCVERLEDLGRYCYNIASGETFADHDWVDAGAIISRLLSLPLHAPTSEVHARLLHGYR